MNDQKMTRPTESASVGCVVCGNSETDFLFVMHGIPLYRCGECGLVFQGQPLSEQETRDFYQKDYYRSLGEDRLPQIEKARACLYRDALSLCAGHRKNNRLLDVGSGYGSFLEAAKNEGWEVWGVEPSRDAAQSSRGSFGDRILNRTVEEIDFPENYFDVITLWNVLDYCLDPVKTLQKVQRWLSPQGILLLRVPNVFFHLRAYRFYTDFKKFFHRIGWKKNPAVYQRANFEARTLRKMLGSAGFQNIRVENAKLTQGDAYGVSPHRIIMTTAKTVLSFLSQCVHALSGGRIFIGSSLFVRAGKEDVTDVPPDFTATQCRILLKKAALHLLAVAGYLLGLPLWARLSGKRAHVRILLYHSVDPQDRHDMNVRPAAFEKQLDFIRSRYEVVAVDKVVEQLRGGKSFDRPSVAITFDDGYCDNYRVVYPLLRKRDLTAAFFLLTGDTEGERKTSHLGDEGAYANRLLSWEEVREMSSAGMIFGSHGDSHSRLKDLSAEQLSREMDGSREKMEGELKKPVKFFSYPYGTVEDFGEREKNAVKQAGYAAAFAKLFGANGPGADLYSLKRIGIEASDTLFTLRAKLNGALGLMCLFDFSLFRKAVRWMNGFFRPSAVRGVKEDPVLLVSMDFPPHRNGVSTISGELGIRIADWGKTMYVIGPDDRGCEQWDNVHRYRIFRMPGYDWGYLRMIPVFFCMPYIVLRYGIRKIFAMNVAYGGLIAWALSFFLRLDYIVFAYGYEFEKVKQNPVLKWLYRKIYGRSRAIICCSQQVSEKLVLFGAEAGKMRVLYPGVDLRRYYPCEVPPDYLTQQRLEGKRIILTVGRLVERKGHDQVLKALPRIVEKFPDVVYAIVGEGAYEGPLRQLARELRIEEYVSFLGLVPEEELLYLYNACEIFVMASREIEKEGHIEGFGIVFLEANACGRPGIGGRTGGVVEAVAEGESGLLVDPHSVDDLAEKIIFLLSRPDEARKMGEKGLRRVREHFNWERYAEEAYRLLCGETRK